MNWLDFMYGENNLNDFLDKLEVHYQAAFWVMDNAYNLMGASRNAKILFDQLEESHTLYKVIESLQFEGLNQLLVCQKSISHYSDVIGKTCFIGDGVVSGNRLAKVTCFYSADSRIEQADFAECVKAITIFLQMNREFSQYTEERNHFFRNLLQTPNPSQQYIRQNLFYYQIKLSKPYVLLAASEWGGGELMYGDLPYYSKILKSVFTSAFFDFDETFAVACVSMKDLLERYDTLTGVASRNKMKLFIGIPYEDEQQTYAYYQQLKRLQQISSATEKVSWYKDYVLKDIFTVTDPLLDLTTFIHLETQRILDYDQLNKTEYFRTAYLLLCKNHSQIEVASLLNIHINTLKYRMKQLEQLFQLNLTNAKNDDWVKLSFHILQYKHNFI